jgi:replicative DNA helicase
VRLKALLHIQKFVNWDEDPYSGIGLPTGSWRPIDESGSGGEKLFIQTGSKMNDLEAGDEDPF